MMFPSPNMMIDTLPVVIKDYIDSTLDERDIVKKNPRGSMTAREEGNRLYRLGRNDPKIQEMILKLYSESLALAQPDSIDMVRAFGNRSALLFHLGKYGMCIIDIDRALRIINKLMTTADAAGKTEMRDLKSKYEDRKERCLESKATDQTKAKAKLPKFIPSKENPDLSESVSLKYDEEQGSHYVANRNIRAGEILIIEKCEIMLPTTDFTYLHCSHCMRFAWTGIPCNSCAVVIYCSDECKQAARDEYHDLECSLLPHFHKSRDIMFGMPSVASRNCKAIVEATALRIFLKILKREGLERLLAVAKGMNYLIGTPRVTSDVQLQNDKFLAYFANSSGNSIKEVPTCISAQLIIQLMEKKIPILLGRMTAKIRNCLQKFLMEIMKIDFIRFRQVQPIKREDRGVFASFFQSFLKHSCYANVNFIISTDCKFIVYAVRPIEKSEKLFITAGCSALTMEKEARQMCIRTVLGFTCECIACTEDWPTLDVMTELSFQKKEHEPFGFGHECRRALGDNVFNLISHKTEEDISIDEDTLKNTSKVFDLIPKYFKGHEINVANILYGQSISTIFLKLYALENDIPNGIN